MWTEVERRLPHWVRRLTGRFSRARRTVQAQITAVFCVFMAMLLLILNVYPVVSTRDAVIRDKEQSLTASASVVSSALAGLDSLNSENVNQVMEILDVTGVTRILITDDRNNVVYDTWAELIGSNAAGEFPVLDRAFSGTLEFQSDFTDQAFTSQTAAPVMVSGSVIGGVYLMEVDTEQGQMIGDIQHRLAVMSAALALIGLTVSAVFSMALTSRIKELAQAVRVVQGGNYTHHIVTRGQDELTELGEEFNSMTDILRQTEASQRQFLSDASHELKTPLASIRLLTDSILQTEEMDRDTMMEFVSDIGQSAARLQRMTEKILDLSRMDSGAPVLRTGVNLTDAVERTLHLLAPLAEVRQVTLRLEGSQPVWILAGEDELEQILFNLAENAVKYNVPGGSVTVTVTGGEQAVLTVADTGIGIPDEDLPYIFARFYRVDKARSREAGGSGLGLSIVRDAVEQLGGKIQVSHGVPSGTVFTVKFPVWKEECSDQYLE